MNKITKLLCTAALACAAIGLSLSAHAAVTDQDKAFLTKASQANFDEIKLSELAENKATNPQVKAFAHKMVTDHTALGHQMMPFAQAWGINPADSLDADHQSLYDKLQGLSGAQFDKQYMDAMLKDHQEAVHLFTQEAQTTTDQKFKQTVMHGKSVVTAHLKMAESLDPKLQG
ncbi:MAG: DUF4142 domain-containing protein [Acidobacteriaceae bacterium]